MLIYITVFLTIKIVFIATQICKEGENHCKICNPITKLCVKCEKDIYSPDNSGGCQNSEKCLGGINHCIECFEDGKLCEICDEGYYPDENGGCSYTDNCEISDEKDCIKCKENFILIGKPDYYYIRNGPKICKSLNSDDFQNCKIINKENGLCKECEEGYYLGVKDKRCINVEHCSESSFGICKNCYFGYYLNQKEQKCLDQKDNFINCRISYDGEFCDECDKDFFLDEEKKCVISNYCIKGDYNKCEKCQDGYYISESDKICTTEKKCVSGRRDIGICTECQKNFYIDFQDGKCKSNLEDNEFKNCIQADNGKCILCGENTYIGEDNKCSFSQYCKKSVDGECIECLDNFYLGLDNKCTEIENCIYSVYYTDFNSCLECIDGYFFCGKNQTCEIAENNLRNCKNSYEGEICEECKNDYYLNKTDNLCYSNNETNKFYKCSKTDKNGKFCSKCIEGYNLGEIDHKCTKLEGCDLSEDENICIECNQYYCLDSKSGQCVYNDDINDEEKKYYFRCNKTNKEGTKCALCNNGYRLKNGLCVDEAHCLEKNRDGSCKKCESKENSIFIQCLNPIFGCVESLFNHNCLECDNILNFEECTKCMDGYDLDENNDCKKIEE